MRAGIITAHVRSTREGNIYTWKCLSVHFWGGGVPGPGRGGPRSQIFRGVPGLRFLGGPRSQILGGSQVSDFQGGLLGLRFSGGSQVSDFGGGTWSQ